MKALLPILISIVIVLACSSHEKITTEFPLKGSMLFFDTITGKYKVSSEDKKLINTWEAFTQAALKHDKAALIHLSAGCVLVNLDSTVAAPEYYKDHFDRIFYDDLISLMADSSKVRVSYRHADVTDITDAYPCMTDSGALKNPKWTQVMISFPLRAGQYEGTTGVLDFIEADSSYKFFGYWTIP